MTKELQDLAWSCLPKEFKEEVKKEYRKGYVCETLTMLITLFGHHNLTSDAEGEEMLTVKRSDVINEFDKLHKLSYKAADLQLGLNAFRTLFGSKCLPDNVESSEPNVESLPQNPTENCDNKSHISADCDKQAEPKFKVGDYARYKGDVHKVVATTKDNRCYLNKILGSIDESDLEPYTEPTDFGREVNFPTKNNLAIYLKKSKNCDNRLQIAAMAMQGILSNIDLFKNVLEAGMETLSGDGFSYQAVAKASLLFADALIAEERS